MGLEINHIGPLRVLNNSRIDKQNINFQTKKTKENINLTKERNKETKKEKYFLYSLYIEYRTDSHSIYHWIGCESSSNGVYTPSNGG